ncbi:hypothetical protein ADJ73_01420 [Arsenicicoccus sp. oral taxon 190]|nr:hypothetical protein ADJ73_01420 [Arsenicicoccus sp. oral taxon 190]
MTRCALELHDTPALRHQPVVRVEDGHGTDLGAALGAHRGGHVHLHVTDKLLGRTAAQAADVLTALAAQVRLTVTLHDLPQPADGPGGFERRAAAYAQVVAAVHGVVVSSRHEAALLDDALAQAGAPALPDDRRAVVPLPVATHERPATPPEPIPPSDAAPGADQRDLVVLGYLYPGKGHEEALDAAATLPDDVGVLALGRPSDGHDDLAEELGARAARLGRRFAVTGYLPDDELVGRLRGAAVPVAPHRHLSASGSINSWLAAGRRPLVPRSRYVEELVARCPGAVLVYDDLAAAARAALADPASTWLGPDVRLTPTRDEAGRCYAAVLARWAS